MATVLRTILPLVATAALGAVALGCAPEPVRAPNPTRSLDERRALEVIRRAVAQEGEKPAPAREVEMRNGKALRVDVSVDGHEFGIAYISDDDADKLGDAIKPPNGPDEKLRLERVGPDGEVRIVLLYQTNYRYDDLAGESHELTTITAERTLTRDVRDFITYAKTKKFK
ncbi:hypothetical protein [Polyangium spumosum]|uniref:Uncharacterized protein n=1 Tax=Polyangium spumosum TaxID=889282 RepID=A0A6N7PTX3_9BACT|nr:hypothetical protein [Polyangium spumosum]MRG92261.1 hypothetical protein [Polyangium spumosum]